MANIVDDFELDGLREDFKNILGIHDEGTELESFDDAKTLVVVNRVVDEGSFNEATGGFDDAVTQTIYTGPAHISPVTYRRDRQELGGGESIRIRQYRAVLPWDSGEVLIDDKLKVSFCSDPQMEGREFDITDVLYESELAARRISMTDTSNDSRDANC